MDEDENIRVWLSEKDTKGWDGITKRELFLDLQNIAGLTKGEASVASNYIFNNVPNDGHEILECESRDRWVEYLEIGLEFSDGPSG